MFYPAGEEPLYGDGEDESSEDECIFNGGIEQKKHETVQRYNNYHYEY